MGPQTVADLLDMLDDVEEEVREIRKTNDDIADDLVTELYELRNIIGRMLVL